MGKNQEATRLLMKAGPQVTLEICLSLKNPNQPTFWIWEGFGKKIVLPTESLSAEALGMVPTSSTDYKAKAQNLANLLGLNVSFHYEVKYYPAGKPDFVTQISHLFTVKGAR